MIALIWDDMHDRIDLVIAGLESYCKLCVGMT